MHLNGYRHLTHIFLSLIIKNIYFPPSIVLLSVKIRPPSYFLCPLNDLTILLFCPFLLLLLLLLLFIFLSRLDFREKILALFSLRDTVLSKCNFQIFFNFLNFGNIFLNACCSICSVSFISLPSLAMHMHAQFNFLLYLPSFFFVFKLSLFLS